MSILEWDSHIDNKFYPYYIIKGIKHFTTMLIILFRDIHSKAARGWAVCIVGGDEAVER